MARRICQHPGKRNKTKICSVNKLDKGHYLIIGLVLTVIILAILSINGCHNSNKRLEYVQVLARQSDSLRQALIGLNQESLSNKKEFENALSVTSGQLALKDNQVQATSLKLDSANKRIQFLLKNRTIVTPSDSSTTTVPNDFITECSTCFSELETQNKLVNTYKKQIDERDEVAATMTINYTNRISKLEAEKKQAFDIAAEMGRTSDEAIKKLQPRRMMYLTLGAMGKKEDVLMGVGAGLMYQDKHKRMFGAVAFGTNQGVIYTGQLTFPLAFRRK